MREVTVTEARGSLSALVDQARQAPVLLTRGGRAVAAIIEAEQLERLRADSDELADIRAVCTAWEDAEQLGETPMSWDDVKAELGLARTGPA